MRRGEAEVGRVCMEGRDQVWAGRHQYVGVGWVDVEEGSGVGVGEGSVCRGWWRDECRGGGGGEGSVCRQGSVCKLGGRYQCVGLGGGISV